MDNEITNGRTDGLTFDERTNTARDWGNILYKIFPTDGRIIGCDVSVVSDNTICISEGYFIARGRVIHVENMQKVSGSTSLQTGVLRLLYCIDLNREATGGIEFAQGYWDPRTTEEAAMQQDIHLHGTTYQLEFAKFSISGGTISLIPNSVIGMAVIDAQQLGGIAASNYATVEALDAVSQKAGDSNLSEIIVLSNKNYGTALPSSGNTTGRLFFLLDS